MRADCWVRRVLVLVAMLGSRAIGGEDAVGHVNSTVTKAVYRHQIADEITSAATVMDSIFGEASSS